jgi:superfamily II DNA or RNA helicase
MADITITQPDAVNLKIDCDRSLAKELNSYFTFTVPNFQYTPAFKKRLWDGKIRLFNLYTQTIYAGLIDHVVKFVKDRGYTWEHIPPVYDIPKPEKVKEFINTLPLSAGGKPIQPYDYQIDAVQHALERSRALLVSPTGSGKSMMIYLLCRWMLDQNPTGKLLIIVPTTSLVAQMLADFRDYSKQDTWKADRNIHTVMSGKDKTSSKRIIISTWQSIYNQPYEYFDDFIGVFGDECHLFKAKSLTSIMSKAKKTVYRIGTTGTLDGTQTHKLVIEGLFGPTYHTTTTKKLIDQDLLSQINIDCLQLQYSQEDIQTTKRMAYVDEIRWVVSNSRRNTFIKTLCDKLTGNTLVLFNFVELQGKPLHELLQKDLKKPVYFIHGETEVESREQIRKAVDKGTDSVLLASYGTCSTGINIRNIHNIIFASPSKSVIRVLQSIGRGLRKSDTKQHMKLFDIADDLRYKSYTNHGMHHLNARLKIYTNEGFPYKIFSIQLPKETDENHLQNNKNEIG